MNIRTGISALAVMLLCAACENETEPRSVVGELASDRIELTAESNEPIVDIPVAEGESVVEDQLLLRQDATRAAARRAEAEAALGQAQARLDELVRGPRRERIAAARASAAGAADELEFRQADYERIRKIHARNLASPELLDRAKAALDAARANDELRRAELDELLRGTTVEQLAQAEHAVAQAAARRDLLAVDVARHELRAPVSGVVDSRLFESGERPAPGQAVLVLLPGKQPHARVYVPEAQRIAVTAGAGATVYVDGIDEPIDGRVRWVSSEAEFTPYFALTEHDRGHLTFKAKVDLLTERERLPDGVPVDVVFDSDAERQ